MSKPGGQCRAEGCDEGISRRCGICHTGHADTGGVMDDAATGDNGTVAAQSDDQVFHAAGMEGFRYSTDNATAATGPWLDDIGKAWNLASSDPMQYYYTAIPVIYSPRFYTRNNDWMERRRELLGPVFGNREFIESMIRLTNSSSNYDVREQLGKR